MKINVFPPIVNALYLPEIFAFFFRDFADEIIFELYEKYTASLFAEKKAKKPKGKG